jgi:hypothetical protein
VVPYQETSFPAKVNHTPDNQSPFVWFTAGVGGGARNQSRYESARETWLEGYRSNGLTDGLNGRDIFRQMQVSSKHDIYIRQVTCSDRGHRIAVP